MFVVPWCLHGFCCCFEHDSSLARDLMNRQGYPACKSRAPVCLHLPGAKIIMSICHHTPSFHFVGARETHSVFAGQALYRLSPPPPRFCSSCHFLVALLYLSVRMKRLAMCDSTHPHPPFQQATCLLRSHPSLSVVVIVFKLLAPGLETGDLPCRVSQEVFIEPKDKGGCMVVWHAALQRDQWGCCSVMNNNTGVRLGLLFCLSIFLAGKASSSNPAQWLFFLKLCLPNLLREFTFF